MERDDPQSKETGLTLMVAVTGVTAVPSAASAFEFHSEITPTTLTGSQIGTSTFTFTAGTLSCTSMTYQGSMTGTTSTTFSVVPAFSGCTAFGFAGATVSVNGCAFVIHARATGNTGTLDVECPGAPITVTASLFGVTKCKVTIDDQTGLTGTLFFNEGAGANRDLEAYFANGGALKYTEHTGSGIGSCSNGAAETGEFEATATVTGENAEGVQKGIWIE